MTKTENLTKIYDECSNGYHKVDDFRAKLLGFLPLASGIAIFGALHGVDGKPIPPENLMALGLFGVLVTVGLLIFELKGILKCTQFIFLGAWIECKMKKIAETDAVEVTYISKFTGYFTELAKGETLLSHVVTEPVASAFIYSTVIAAWSFVMVFNSDEWKWKLPATVFIAFWVTIYIFWRKAKAKIRLAHEDPECPMTNK